MPHKRCSAQIIDFHREVKAREDGAGYEFQDAEIAEKYRRRLAEHGIDIEQCQTIGQLKNAIDRALRASIIAEFSEAAISQ
ncbi:hypothetical protein [Acidithiobacillus ferrianus]|uniref:hypothetical protein n=1 Tax=Acidithiobacillus ferrianus TaxID=2678518 RepID=UPI0034E48D8E